MCSCLFNLTCILAISLTIALYFVGGLFVLPLANLSVKSLFNFFNHLFLNITNTRYRLLIKVNCSVEGFYFAVYTFILKYHCY